MDKSFIYKDNQIIQGLMRLENVSEDKLYELIKFDIGHGIHFFDISDVYMNGECEAKLGRVLLKHPKLKDQMIIQTKCGIIKENGEVSYLDLSYDHIVESCKASLKRMNIDHIDSFLLHRPDIFMDATEVARAFATLNQQGLVSHFGVSNFPHEAIKYLTDQTNIPIEVNQLQMGLGHLHLIREVLNCNMDNNEGVEHTGELFFYMKRYNIVLQCWSPFQVGFFGGNIFSKPEFKKTVECLEELAKKYKTTKESIAIAFLLNLSNNIQVIFGSMSIEHISAILDAKNIKLSKVDWYKLYKSTGNDLP